MLLHGERVRVLTRLWRGDRQEGLISGAGPADFCLFLLAPL